MLGGAFLAAGALVVLLGNAALNHAQALSVAPFYAPSFNYLFPVGGNLAEKERLIHIVNATCHQETAARVNLLVVTYASLNENSANFYSEKNRLDGGLKCPYIGPDLTLHDASKAVQRIRQYSPAYIVTLTPEAQVKPVEWTNELAISVTEALAAEPGLQISEESPSGLLIYKNMK